MKNLIFKVILALWKICPFKKVLANILNNFPSWKRKLYQDLRFKGIMSLTLDGKQLKLFNPGFTTIENEIFWNGLDNGWEKESMKLWRELCLRSTIILDIGANSGIYSMVASVVNPKAHIYSFEPVKRTAEILKENIRINRTPNVELFEVAVSNVTGSATFYDVSSQSQYSASLNEEILSECEDRISYSVDVIKLDDFEPLQNKRVDLIKIDVEMHEPEAIAGMLKLITRDRPSILIEVLTVEIGMKINALLVNLNYHCFSIDEEHSPKPIPSIQQSDFHNIILLQENRMTELGLPPYLKN